MFISYLNSKLLTVSLTILGLLFVSINENFREMRKAVFVVSMLLFVATAFSSCFPPPPGMGGGYHHGYHHHGGYGYGGRGGYGHGYYR